MFLWPSLILMTVMTVNVFNICDMYSYYSRCLHCNELNVYILDGKRFLRSVM